MQETEVSALGHLFETSHSTLPVRPINLAGCSFPGGTVTVVDSAGVMQRGGQELRYHRAEGMRCGMAAGGLKKMSANGTARAPFRLLIFNTRAEICTTCAKSGIYS